MEAIRIRGARTHNLKNISVDLPRHQLVVITGLSGSGKSSLAFDTLYAEGQRRYVESLSAYARQFLQLMDKPDVDLIEGLSPAISIEQKSAGHNPRSTVGTITEIHDYLRLLYARVGTPYCPEHGLPLQAQSVSQMVDKVLAWAPDTRLAILAPLARSRKGSFEDECAALQAQGFVRVRVNGEMMALDDLAPLKKTGKHDFDVVVDRLRIKPESQQRLAESFETALMLAEGRAIALNMDTGEEHPFSSRYACPVCHHSLTELEPRLFSFNNPVGACPSCDGLGQVDFFDPKRVVAFPELSLTSGAIAGWDKRNAFTHTLLTSLAAHYGFDIDTPFEELSPEVRDRVLFGSGDEEIPFLYLNEKGRSSVKKHPFEGVIPNLERRWRETDSSAVREELGKYRHTKVCPDCHGSRLRPEARHVLIGNEVREGERRGCAIYEVESLSLSACLDWFRALELTGARKEIAERIVREIEARLEFLNNVGLSYLSLDRSADTISGGEAQRIRLASQIGSGLTGVMYVLDEPSIGLHQRDNDRLIQTLRHLRDLGNSVIVVEHDEDMIRAADFVLDMGPGAGEHGGRIVAQGSPRQLADDENSLTGLYLSGKRRIVIPDRRPVAPDMPWLKLTGCRGNNLKNVDLAIPAGRLVCVTGVSGSGKSTLINDTLAAAVAQQLHRAQTEPAPFDTLDGLSQFDKIINVDQSPIGRTPRSNPATYTGMFTPIRELFAGVPEARTRGYDPGRFSFNVKGGRCEACQGDGVVKVEMHFLPDMYVPCDVCAGKRYNRETLEIRYRGKNISQVLDLTVEQALTYFEAVPTIARKLQTLIDVGLSYLRLGQAATTLSGGEAQRVKLSLELSKRSTGRTLYILDEPTTGLHFQDIALLLDVLRKLVDGGNTVVIIEHNLDVIKTADWVIDMGPEGGSGGGRIVAQGTPEDIAACAESHTGGYLRPLLGPGKSGPA
ncbi:excinuclease ABC subunit UvrA [Parapusillimonas granuli]|uniref:UvrABC system protein A n=1 Tax=Parapusillimonas granuli TaxID=380911 RepID=A0A853FW60_9BURK|nr:excinuclease ABC subunit UvrA [Parapusillimonas granuli]MBB5216265.1 excinuclease ABC subunit A [Parapusillimonas granuli]MEB2400539.1 excinuclease ABC subunit UvrA [Alcaligenaceae bacterium]NYT47942.1 excinuclease ABC subunit UvrA [Parapusillimonas granuli]